MSGEQAWPPAGPMGLVDWLDREYGASVREAVARGVGSDFGASWVWGRVLESAWRRGLGFEAFESRGHCENWVWATVERARGWLRLEDWRGRRREAVLGELSSSVGEERVNAPASVGSYVEQCLERLSPKRRAAVEVTVLGNVSGVEACRILGCRHNTLYGNAAQGLSMLRAVYLGTYVSRADRQRRSRRDDVSVHRGVSRSWDRSASRLRRVRDADGRL